MTRAAFVRGPVNVWAPQIAELLDAVGDIAYVAGGAARQLFMTDAVPPAWDIDLFLYEPGDFEEVKTRIQALGYVNAARTEHSAEFEPRTSRDLPVQVIEPFEDAWSKSAGEPEDVLSCFSFTTEMFAIVTTEDGFEAVIGATAVADTDSRMLVVQNVTNPLIVSLRAVKHGFKGFGIAPEQMQLIFDAYMERAKPEAKTWR